MSLPTDFKDPGQERKSRQRPRKIFLSFAFRFVALALFSAWLEPEGFVSGLTSLKTWIIALVVAVGFSVGDFI